MINIAFYDGTHATFRAWALDFAQRHPRYMKNGSLDWPHVCKAIEACGYSEITASNIAHVKAALEQRAAAKATA